MLNNVVPAMKDDCDSPVCFPPTLPASIPITASARQIDDVAWAQHDPSVEAAYAGKWVVPLGRQIVSYGTDPAAAIEEAARLTGRSADELVACAVPHHDDWLVDA